MNKKYGKKAQSGALSDWHKVCNTTPRRKKKP
jgi:hypothetical protein